jgi:hypothetical protein
MESQVNDSDVLKYLLSHAPVECFYLFTPSGSDDTLIKYFDSAGVSWNLMEDDDAAVDLAVAFLKKAGVKVFSDYSGMLEYEQIERAKASGVTKP